MSSDESDLPHASSDSDDAPEAVSLVSSKTAALTRLQAAQKAQSVQATAHRERRRALDGRLKDQAAERKQRIQDALTELRQKSSKHQENGKAQKSRKRTASVAPTRRLFIGTEKEGPSSEENSEKEEELDGPAKVVLLRNKRVVDMNAGAAKTLAQKREEMRAFRDTRTRVHSSALMAHTRVGRPAHRFVLPEAEAEELRAKLVRKPSGRQKSKKPQNVSI